MIDPENDRRKLIRRHHDEILILKLRLDAIDGSQKDTRKIIYWMIAAVITSGLGFISAWLLRIGT